MSISQAFPRPAFARVSRRAVLAGAAALTLALTALGAPLARGQSEENGATAARAYLIVDDKYGHILAGAHTEDKLQVGSLTKIATAVVVFDWARLGGHTLDQMVPITETALAAGGSNPVGYQPGDELTMRDLLYAALLQSDNVAAESLAGYVGKALPLSEGTRAGAPPTVQFVAQMNALARSLNMKRTRFLNPTGIDGAEKPYSTALDIGRLTHHALSKAEFRFVIAQKERRITIHRAGATSDYLLRNTNELLGTHHVDGVKTGQTTLAGGCLVVSATRDPVVTDDHGKPGLLQRRLIVVVLGSSDRFHLASQLLDRGEALFDAWSEAGRVLDPKTTL